MAKAPTMAADLITEGDIADAISNTEQEIFDEATGADPAENDGDRSLEKMDDDIPGAGDGDESDEDPEDEDESVEAEAEGEEDPDAIAAQEREPQRGIPSARLRQEADARRAAEAEQRAAQAEARELRSRLEALERGQKALEKGEPKAPPDMFADPEGWAKHHREEAKKEALAEFRQEQAQRDEQRVNTSLGEAARGPRSFEFKAAFDGLQSLDPRDPQAQRTVRGIVNSADPAKALFDWWDENGGEDFRESVRAQLIPNYRPQPRRDASTRVAPERDMRPQPVFRNPKSLNGATGGNQRVTDPELYDDSEGAVFRYATR